MVEEPATLDAELKLEHVIAKLQKKASAKEGSDPDVAKALAMPWDIVYSYFAKKMRALSQAAESEAPERKEAVDKVACSLLPARFACIWLTLNRRLVSEYCLDCVWRFMFRPWRTGINSTRSGFSGELLASLSIKGRSLL